MDRTPFTWSRTLAASAIAATLAACGGSDGSPSAVLGASENAAGLVPAPASTPAPPAASTPATPKSIVDTAASLPQFSSLVAALGFASRNGDLVNLLSGAGAFTVFAPTNEAFDALARELTRDPSATAAALLVPGNEALVRAVLEYHVLGATVRKADVPLGSPIDPVLAGTDAFRIDASGAALVITDGRLRTSRIIATDVTASNGVVHVIDKVLLPAAKAADRTIAEIALGNENFSTLVKAVQFASVDGDLLSILSNPGTLTVFAPTNAAFDALARELTGDASATGDALLVPANRDLVRAVLRYHVLGARVLRAEVPVGRPIDPVLAGTATFTVNARGDALVITDARRRDATIAATDVFATNGVIHVLDRVILPPAH
jgi:uncharacterized surface protein with fasciclin (FAS1) repeats